MGVMSSIGYNTGIASQNRANKAAANSTIEAVPAANLRPGDRVVPDGHKGDERWTVKSAEATGKRVPGLGLIRFGTANSRSVRIVLSSDEVGPTVVEFSEAQLVLRERRT